MEPTSTGSITSTKITTTTITKINGNNYEHENINYLNPSFLNHRGNYHQNHNQFNTSIQEENAILSNSPNIHSDSGYNSSYCNSILTTTTATNYNNSGANISYVSTITTTPPPSQKSSNHSYQYHHTSNLNTIPENSPDAGIKLTPVTKNLRKILNIHITTPKSQNNLSTITPTINVENYDGNYDVDDGLDDKLKIKRDDIAVVAAAAAAATATATKRNILTELVFDDYQSTPKKKKLDDNSSESCQKLSGARSIISSLTPLRDRRAARIHKKPYRKKLRSAPNFDAEFFNRDNAENIEDIDSGAIYHTSHFTPIRSPYIQDKRTPLSSSSSNLMQASTPKSLGKYDNSSRSSSSVFEKSASVRKLLSFSDKEFEALLGSSAEVQTTISKAENPVVETEDIYQEDSFREYKIKQPIISSYNSIVPLYVPETDTAKKSFKRTLKFAFQATPSSSTSGEETPKTSKKATPSPNVPQFASSAENNESSTEKNDSNIFHDDNFNDYKALYPIIGNVIHDRRILKRERSSKTARLIDIKRESFSLSRLNRTGNGNKKFCSSETIKQNKIERNRKESRGGFQKILGYKPSSYDLKISPRFDDTKDDGEIEKKLTDEGSDMDVSMGSLKSSANRSKLNIKGCESMREMNEKLLKYGDETHILDSDLDISKESIKSDNKKNLSGGECDMDITRNVQQFQTDNVSHESVRDCNSKMFKYEREFCKFELNLDISKEISDLHKSPFTLSPSTPPPSSSSLKNERSEDDLMLFNSNNSIKIPDFSSIHFEKEIGEITPPRRRRSSSPLCQSNDNDDVLKLKVSFSENVKFLPTTPKKIKQHSNHHHTTIDYEKNEILHPTIPRTPSKKSSLAAGSMIGGTSATTSSTSLSSIKYKYAPISLKRKASISKKDTDKRSKIFYDGCTHLNILAKLERYDLVLDRIFDMLSSQDLINLTLTSKHLRNIVLINQKSRNRISKFITEHQKTKENNDMELNDVYLISDKLQQQQQYQHQQHNHHHHHQQQTPITRMKTIHKSPSSLPMISSNGTNCRGSILQSRKFSVDSNCGNNAVTGTRLPFKNCNLIFDQRRSSVTNIVQKSPPVSPSKRKFHENQKVVKLLSANEKLMKCPRCSRSSRIIKVFPSPFDEFTNQFSNHHNYNNNNNNNNNNLKNNESQKIFKMYTTTTTTSNQQETFHASTLSTLKNFNYNNNDNYNDFVPISNSQPVSNQFVPVSSKISSNKLKFVKSMSADSAYFMPVTPIKRHHHHHHQQSQFSNYSDDVAVNNFSTNLQQQQYGECTGIACKYRFCLDCLCEYHPNSPCKITTALNNSPSKEDVQNGILQINSLSSAKKMTATTKMTTITSSSTTTATATTSAPAAASTAATSNSRSLKIRRKSLKRLCF